VPQPLNLNVMRGHMLKIAAMLIIALSLSGCTVLVGVALFNNGDSAIEVCNLNLKNKECKTIEPQSFKKILLISEGPVSSLKYSITKSNDINIYTFNFKPYGALASNIYCADFPAKSCDIPVQYENNGLLYWAGQDQELPAKNLPNQPLGFPVAPDA
jgi:hypothetical protein